MSIHALLIPDKYDNAVRKSLHYLRHCKKQRIRKKHNKILRSIDSVEVYDCA